MSTTVDDGRDKTRRALTRHAPREHRFVDGQPVHLVVDEERCDPVWEQQEAERRRAAFEQASQYRLAERRRQRETRPWTERLARARAEAATLTNRPARPVAATPASSEDGDSPLGRRPPGEEGVGPEYDALERRGLLLAEDYERVTDERLGLIAPRPLLLAEEKDRELFERYAGVPARQVERERRDLGSKNAVLNHRRRAGLTEQGLDPETGLAPTPERVREGLRRLRDPGGLKAAA